MICPFPFLRDRGSPLLVYNCITALSELGHQVDLLCFPLGRDPKVKNIKVHNVLRFTKNIPIGYSWMKPIYDILLLLKALRFRIRNDFDIIHGQHFEGALIGAFIKGKLPLYYTIHSLLSEEMKITKVFGAEIFQTVFKFFEKFIYRVSDKIFPVSPSFIDVVGQYSNKAKCNFIPDIAPGAEIKKSITEKVSGIFHGKVKFMYAGNLSVYQGVDMLIKAFRGLDACLLIVGGAGDKLDYYKRLAKKYSVNNIHFFGQQLAEDIPSYLEAADVLVSPRLEGSNIPSKLYTYIQAAKPIILTNIEAHTQLEKDAFLFCEPTSNDLKCKISQMQDNSTRAKYQKLVENILEKFTRNSYLQLLQKAYV